LGVVPEAASVHLGTIFITHVVGFSISPSNEVYASTIVPIVVTLVGVVSEADPEITVDCLGYEIIVFFLAVNGSEFHAHSLAHLLGICERNTSRVDDKSLRHGDFSSGGDKFGLRALVTVLIFDDDWDGLFNHFDAG
jgi:hypothetical protein